MTAVAQQPASAPQNPQPVAATQPSPEQSGQAQSNLAPPTTMDQVIDRIRNWGRFRKMIIIFWDAWS
jgi:hypothetical protein